MLNQLNKYRVEAALTGDEQTGTYWGLRVHPDSQKHVLEWLHKLKIKDPEKVAKWHMTVHQSPIPNLVSKHESYELHMKPHSVQASGPARAGAAIVFHPHNHLIQRRSQILDKEGRIASQHKVKLAHKVHIPHLFIANTASNEELARMHEHVHELSPIRFHQEFTNPLHLKKPREYHKHSQIDHERHIREEAERQAALRHRNYR